MDSSTQQVVLPQSESDNLPPLFSSQALSASALVTWQMAKLCTTMENALGSIPITLRDNKNLEILNVPYRVLHLGMFNAVTNLTKRLYNPLNLIKSYNGSWDRIGSLTRRLSGLVDDVMFSFSRIRGTPNKEPCTLSHINQLANQLQQLAENVANLQEANEEFKSRYQQENLLAEVGDMKVYLELLYQQLRHEEMKKLHLEEENTILRHSAEKYSLISGTSWDSSARRESNDNEETFFNSSSVGTSPVIHCSPAGSTNLSPETKGVKNPPAIIQTSMSEFQLKISYLYQEATAAWVRPPKEGDVIVFSFSEPILLKKFKIGTGHFEYPTNVLSEATVEILPTSTQPGTGSGQSLVNLDNYLVIGHFDRSGLAEGVVDWQSLGTIQSLRVKIHGNYDHWIIMSELFLETATVEEETTLPLEEYFECW